ncbi:MAG TPA: adenylate kinase [Acidimicrobiia bacterium]|nr:adenylate kinase [Acidimicrobiia bacterium]
MSKVNRVVVVGCSGSGKTTLAREIARRLDIPRLEMDAVMHDGDWNATPDHVFAARLAEFATGDRWVIDGNYASHGASEAVWPRADTVVWVDPPKRVVVSRVVRRTLKRMITREELWNGLREPLGNLYKRDPYENIIVWAWTRYDSYRRRYEETMRDGTWAHATVRRLQDMRTTRQFLNSLE